MKKFMKLFIKNIIVLMILGFIILYYNTVSATTITLSANVAESQLKEGDNIKIHVVMNPFTDIGEGVNAYIITFEYNTENFEFVKAEGANGWNSPTYNENNIKNGSSKFVATKNNFDKSGGDICIITLMAKKDLNQLDSIGRIYNISFAAKVNGKTTTIAPQGNINIVGKENDNQGNDNQENDNQKNSYKKSSDANMAEVQIPNAGINLEQTIHIIIIIAFINSIIIFYKYKKVY